MAENNPSIVTGNNELNQIESLLAQTTLEEDDTDKPDPTLLRVKNEALVTTEDAKIVTSEGAQTIVSPLQSTMTFEQLGLSGELLQGVKTMGYTKPSRIQGLSIPVILDAKSVPPRNFIGQAQSGTGKTAAFGLGMLSRIDATKNIPQAICLSPTRELAIQTYNVVTKLATHTKITTLLMVANETLPQRITSHVIIGTPGKIHEQVFGKKTMKMDSIEVFVLDEADQMLLGATNSSDKNQSIKILSKLPRRNESKNSSKQVPRPQILFFSATYSSEISAFAEDQVPEPRTTIYIPPNKLSVDKLFQYYMKCVGEDSRIDALDKIFSHFSSASSIIFVETRKQAKEVCQRMKTLGHETSVIHGGDMPPKERDSVMSKFRSGTNRILVTTNLLSRGIDVLNVALVINYDLPIIKPIGKPAEPDYDTYLHRIGRSARFGNVGAAINLVFNQESFTMIQKVEKFFFPKKTDKDPSRIQEITLNRLEEISEKLAKFL
jgi:ATP-dependent RNA helicase DDX19/DBP5